MSIGLKIGFGLVEGGLVKVPSSRGGRMYACDGGLLPDEIWRLGCVCPWIWGWWVLICPIWGLEASFVLEEAKGWRSLEVEWGCPLFSGQKRISGDY